MLELSVNGAPYTDFISAEVTVALSTLANDFSFVTSAVGDFPPLHEGDTVKVLVDRVTVLTGTIDEVSGGEKEGKHDITYSGRDKTGDLIDSQIDVIDEIRASESLTLKRLIEIVLAHIQLDIRVIDTLSPDAFNVAEDILDPQVGQDAWEYIKTYASKRQALLPSTGAGDISIVQSSPTDSGATVQRLKVSGSNNVLEQEWDLVGSKRFKRYIYKGQLDPRALNVAGTYSADTVQNQDGLATDDDPNVRVSRQRVVVVEESYSKEQLTNRAKWELQLAKARATTYSCVVKGHQKPTKAGGIWEINTLVQVNSETADISRKMLLNVVTFAQAEGMPTTSTLEFVEKNVYTIAAKLLASKVAGSQSDAFRSVG